MTTQTQEELCGGGCNLLPTSSSRVETHRSKEITQEELYAGYWADSFVTFLTNKVGNERKVNKQKSLYDLAHYSVTTDNHSKLQIVLMSKLRDQLEQTKELADMRNALQDLIDLYQKQLVWMVENQKSEWREMRKKIRGVARNRRGNAQIQNAKDAALLSIESALAILESLYDVIYLATDVCSYNAINICKHILIAADAKDAEIHSVAAQFDIHQSIYRDVSEKIARIWQEETDTMFREL